MNRIAIITSVVFGICTVTAAQQQLPSGPVPTQLARLPEAIRVLPWQSIDLGKVDLQEYCRALLIMNYVLGELAPVRASESDMMSAYITAQNLGTEFVSAVPPPQVKLLAYTDATKVAVALLRGPLAVSSYANSLSGASTQTLLSYKNLYERTCQRRWDEITESVQQTNAMRTFIQSKGRMQNYQAWAKLESQNRQQKYQLEMEHRRTVAQAEQAQREEQSRQTREQQLEQENAQLQQALAAAQAQQMTAQPADASQSYETSYEAPDYYAAGTTWYRDPDDAYRYRAQTEQRLSTWHSAGVPVRTGPR